VPVVVEAVVSVDVPPESAGGVVEAVVSVDVPAAGPLVSGVVDAVVSVDVPAPGAEAVLEETVAQSSLTCACCSVLSDDQLDLISSSLLSVAFESSVKKASAIGPDQSLVSALSASVIIIVSVAPGVAVVAPDVPPVVSVVLLCAMALVPSASVSMEAAISLYIMFLDPVCGWSFALAGREQNRSPLPMFLIFRNYRRPAAG
jgi:hypothetical protein